MKRRQFVASSLLAVPALTTAEVTKPAATKELYELRTYESRFGSPQSNIENYLKDALMPALNRQGVKTVGAFREVQNRSGQTICIDSPPVDGKLRHRVNAFGW